MNFYEKLGLMIMVATYTSKIEDIFVLTVLIVIFSALFFLGKDIEKIINTKV